MLHKILAHIYVIDDISAQAEIQQMARTLSFPCIIFHFWSTSERNTIGDGEMRKNFAAGKTFGRELRGKVWEFA
jgi:hypothetical protein